MAKRTFKFLGTGVGATPVHISATFNGQTVYTGEIPTVASLDHNLGLVEGEVLFTVDVDMSLSGNIPVTITPIKDVVYLTGVIGNYCCVDMVVSGTVKGQHYDDIGASYTGTVPVLVAETSGLTNNYFTGGFGGWGDVGRSGDITVPSASSIDTVKRSENGEIISCSAYVLAGIETNVSTPTPSGAFPEYIQY